MCHAQSSDRRTFWTSVQQMTPPLCLTRRYLLSLRMAAVPLASQQRAASLLLCGPWSMSWSTRWVRLVAKGFGLPQLQHCILEVTLARTCDLPQRLTQPLHRTLDVTECWVFWRAALSIHE